MCLKKQNLCLSSNLVVCFAKIGTKPKQNKEPLQDCNFFDISFSFLRFFELISILTDSLRKNEPNLFAEYFGEFFDTHGIPEGV